MTRLRLDQRGAVAMMTLFMSAIGIALVGMVAATADAISHREQLQDAADAAVYSGATTMADGLNMTSLVNMTMSSLASLVTAVQSMLLMIIAGKALANALAPPTEGWSLGAMGPLAGVLAITTGFMSSAVAPAMSMIKAGYSAATALRQQAADVGVHLGGQAAMAAMPEAAVAPFRMATRLPTINADPREMCNRGLSFSISQSIPRFVMDYNTEGGSPWAFVTGLVYSAGRGMVEQASGTLCGATLSGNTLQIIDRQAEMGGEKFQVQYSTQGPAPPKRGLLIAPVGTFGREGGPLEVPVPEGPKALLQRTAFTQAEAYFQGSEDREDWGMHMGWMARLRPFRGGR